MVHSRLAKGKSSNHIGFQNSSPYSRVSIAFTRQVSKFQLHSAVAPTVPRRKPSAHDSIATFYCTYKWEILIRKGGWARIMKGFLDTSDEPSEILFHR